MHCFHGQDFWALELTMSLCCVLGQGTLLTFGMGAIFLLATSHLLFASLPAFLHANVSHCSILCENREEGQTTHHNMQECEQVNTKKVRMVVETNK